MTCSRYTESDSGRIKVVTSATRPTGASRYIGQHIYETDTDRRRYFDGTGWIILSEPFNAWNTSASWSGITGGSPTYIGGYHRSDGWCDFRATLIFGGAPLSIAGFAIVLPFTPGYIAGDQLSVQFHDNAGTFYRGYNAPSISAAVGISALLASGTYVTQAGAVSTTLPFTFGVGDSVEVSGRFRMNSRYS